MAEKTLTMTLKIKVRDLSDEERKKEAEMCGAEVDELPMLDEVTPGDITRGIESALTDNDVVQDYVWAGSECYAKFNGIEILDAKWED